MSNYTKTTNFAAKDSLPSGNAAKIVKGAEIDTEFNNIATASATKANANNAALTGTTVFETLSDGTIGVTGWVDEDNMSSNSAVLIPTQQSVKAYVDSQVTAQDLDVTDGSASIDIDLDSESLGILGGTGITSSASGTGVTLAIDSTVTTLTGTQTLTNKTLTTPVISGALTTNSTIDGRDVATDGSKLDGIESGATADQTAAQIKTAYESNADTNAFTDADESKLDGIEASADVTDTTNVTAAGALMDSELTSIASVKAMNQGVATGDSPTFAGVTAPITGNVTGNLTGNVTGNVTGDLTGAVTGNVAGNLTGSVLTAAQTNITSVGTLGALTVTGDVTVDTNTLKIDSTNNRVGILNASPDVTLDIGTATDAVHMPVGTTAQRPTGAAGYFRYNSSLEQFEGYTSEWGSIGGGGGTNTFTTDSFTGNGSTTAYALTQTVSSEDNLLVFIEGVFQQQDAYSIATASGTTTLTFSAAPANGNAILIYSVAAAVSGSNLNIDSMTGDGSDVTLTLSISPVNENNTQVFIDGVYQSKSNYSISGTTLTFSTAPPTGSAVEVMTFTQTDINVPVDGTITPAKIASGDFYFDTDTLYVDATNDRVGINNSSPVEMLTLGSTSDTNVRAQFLSSTTGANTIQFGDGTGAGAYRGYINYTHSDDALAFAAAGSERMKLDSSGIDVVGDIGFSGRFKPTSGSSATSASAPKICVGYDYDTGFFQDTTNTIGFATAGTERMRIDASGNLLVGQTSQNQATVGSSITPAGVISTAMANATSGANNYHLYSTNASAYRFYVGMHGTVFATSTTISAISDIRYKENIRDLDDGLSKIMALQPRKFDWKEGKGRDVKDDRGWIAQEIETVFPDLVDEWKDEAPEGEEPYKSVRPDLIPVLVKAIQEQQAAIESQATAITDLTTRLTALENN